jgi:hypothetical protein
MNIEAMSSSETWGNFCCTTQRNIADDTNLQKLNCTTVMIYAKR